MRHKDATSMIPNSQDNVRFAFGPFLICLLPRCRILPNYTMNTLISISQIEFTKSPPQIVRKALLLTNNRASSPTPTQPHALRG